MIQFKMMRLLIFKFLLYYNGFIRDVNGEYIRWKKIP